MPRYYFAGHCEGTFDRKKYQINLGKYFSKNFRKHNVESVILTPRKEFSQEKTRRGKSLVPLSSVRAEFNVINLYPDFFKMLKYAGMEEKSKAKEVVLRDYSGFEIPLELREHTQHFGERLLIVAPFMDFLQIWDKDAIDYYESMGPGIHELLVEYARAYDEYVRHQSKKWENLKINDF